MTHRISSYNAFREEGYPTIYRDLTRKIWFDVTFFRICFLFSVAYISFICILPGFRGTRRFFVFIRWTISFVIGFLIIVCNFMPFWERGSLDVITPYRAGSSVHINATVGLNIGLRGINITLKGLPVQQFNEIIDYNEQFIWTWLQGKPGFGYDAGIFHKQYREAQYKGLPLPILWIAETFTIDYEHVRFGRYYRQSGWFAHIFLWLALPLFILANILFQMVIPYGSLFAIFTGISILMANLAFTFLKCSLPLELAFEASGLNETRKLNTNYSWCYYANLSNGAMCICIGIITLLADLRFPDETANFFGNDVLQCYEDYFADPQEKQPANNTRTQFNTGDRSDNEVVLRKKHNNPELGSRHVEMTSALKRVTLSNRFSRFQRSTIRKIGTPLTPEPEAEEMPLYENFRQFDTIGEELNNEKQME